MKTSSTGLALIKSFEGELLTAYADPATGGDPWTIGVGHTGSEVHRGLKITSAQSMAYLASDVAKFEKAIIAAVKVPLTQNMFDALVSWTFNVGSGNMRSSTLLKKLNAADYDGAAKEFANWNKAAGSVMAGLTRRRAVEAALFRK